MIQFLIEGVLLTFTGGVIGYFIGMILAYGIWLFDEDTCYG